MLLTASQTREPIDTLLCVPDLNVVHVDACFNLFADEPTVNGIHVAADLYETPAAHPHSLRTNALQATWRKAPQRCQIFGHLLATRRVATIHDGLQELFVAL